MHTNTCWGTQSIIQIYKYPPYHPLSDRTYLPRLKAKYLSHTHIPSERHMHKYLHSSLHIGTLTAMHTHTTLVLHVHIYLLSNIGIYA